jgi:hypothetical protein
MEIMLKNKNGFQVNISLSIFFIAFCDLFTDFPSYLLFFFTYDCNILLCLIDHLIITWGHTHIYLPVHSIEHVH